MLQRHNNKGPSATWRRGAGPDGEPPGRPQHYLSADTLPLAISWVKGDRPIILGKLFWRDGRVWLGTPYAWRHLPESVSLPDLALRALLHLGVTDWLVRDDLRKQAWRVDLRRLMKAPLRGGERYVALTNAEPMPWKWWPYATKSVDLLELAQAAREVVGA